MLKKQLRFMKELLAHKLFSNWKYLIGFLILLIIFSSTMTLMLRGRLTSETYRTIQGVEDIEKVDAYNIKQINPKTGFLEDFTENNLSNWQFYSQNGSLFLKEDSLVIQSSFTLKETNEVAIAYEQISVDLNEYPTFSIRLKAPQTVYYHIRFSGLNLAGDDVEVWWESSPLDDRRGTGDWENITINLKLFSDLAAPLEQITVIDEIQIIIDDSMEFDDVGNVSLYVDYFSFSQAPCSIESVDLSESGLFNALKIKLSDSALLGKPWNSQRIIIYYEIESNGKIPYSIYVFNKGLNIFSFSKGPIFASTEEVSFDQYEIATFVSNRNQPEGVISYFLYEELEDGFTLLFISEDLLSNSGFNSIDVESIEISYAIDGLKESVSIEETYAFLILILYFLLLGVLPIMLIVFIYKHIKSGSWDFSYIFVFIILVSGLLISSLLSLFTGHSYDMEIWTYHARSYYESGLVTLESWPTMPLFYYLLLVSYSFYALIQSVFGINDPVFFVHPSRMLESLFIKSSFLIFGVISFIFIFKILKSYRRANKETDSIFGACLYFFGFLNFFVSAVWGMYDGIAVAFLLIGVYYGLVRENYLLGILAFSLSGLTKPFGFIGFIPLIVEIVRKKQRNMLVACISIPIALSFLLYLPILLSRGFSGILYIFQRFIKGTTGLGIGNDISTVVGYQGIIGSDLTQLLYPYLTIFLMGILLFKYILNSRSKEFDTSKESIKFMALSFIIFYLTGLRVYPQHYLWIIPFFILYSIFTKKKELISTVLLISFVIAFIGPASVASYGYFLFGAPYNMIKIISTNDVSVLATSISFVFLISFIQIINPTMIDLSFKKTLKDFIFLIIQFSVIFTLFYAKQHSILNLPYLMIFLICFGIVFLNPSIISYLKYINLKMRNIE